MTTNGQEKAPCLACGSTERDEFVDGSIQCTDCAWPVLPSPDDYYAMGATPDGRMLPVLTQQWAPCTRCGLPDDREPDDDWSNCQECDASLKRQTVRQLVRNDVVAKLRDNVPTDFDRDELRCGDALVVSNQRLVGADPFTYLLVLKVHDDSSLDLVRSDDGTWWAGVPAEYVQGRI